MTSTISNPISVDTSVDTSSVDIQIAFNTNAASKSSPSSSSSSASPTGVNDQRLLRSERPTNNTSEKEQDDTESFLPLVPADFQRAVLKSYGHAEQFCYETQQNFVLDRKAITTMILTVLASLVGGICVAVVALGGLALITCPLWLPLALITCPLWLPLAFFTSPIWVTASATVVGCLLIGGTFLLTVLIFFTWPAEWLPDPQLYSVVDWYLRHRNAATLQLAKLQAKFVLYAAGVGPAADAVFVLMDKVDLEALTSKLQRVDWKNLGHKLQQMELQEVQATVMDIVMSLIR